MRHFSSMPAADALESRAPVVGCADGWELGGLVRLGLADERLSVRHAVARAMDPLPSEPEPAEPDVVLMHDPGLGGRRATDVHGPAGDATTTFSDGRSLHVTIQGRRCTIPDPWRDSPAVISYETDFPLSRVMNPLVRPALQVAIHRAGGATLHASAVVMDGRACLVAGWSETGKTEVALGLVDGGAHFLSDKWAVVTPDHRVAAFPVGVGIRRWLVQYLPSLRSSLPARARLQFTAAAVGEVVTTPVHAAGRRHPAAALVAELAGRATALAGRVGVTNSELRDMLGQEGDGDATSPLGAVVLLRTVPPGTPPLLRELPAERAAARLARSAAYERRPFLGLMERAGYAFPAAPSWRDDWLAEEQERLAAMLRGVPVAEVQLPFPTDPRPAAELIRRHLS